MYGFQVFPIKLPNSPFYRCLYIKKHSLKAKNNQNNFTLFVTNLAPQMTVGSLEEIFQPYGKIEKITLGNLKSNEGNGSGNKNKKRKNQLDLNEGIKLTTEFSSTLFSNKSRTNLEIAPNNGFAHIVFDDSRSIKNVLKGNRVDFTISTKSKKNNSKTSSTQNKNKNKKNTKSKSKAPKNQPTKNSKTVIGLSKWKKDKKTNKSLTSEDILIKATTFMDKYESTEKRIEKRRKRLQHKPDKDGFMLPKVKSSQWKLSDKELIKRQENKDKRKRLVNFYRFQHRQMKEQEIQQLRSKFQRDKEKITEMKKKKQFDIFKKK
ncbi:RIBOSOMAL RNA-PROCESSING PROTEIN 7 [Anaeramoeba flamelloides]|uniref:RIBOSOMAL RNA-PROCESSING PROTEIN 7 n=1 Tax=Anaeramoeba flamelloides TaxID=1746091 RepID=A0AAV7ZV80_9EUKA|nr:RIBOSOMAL RNA-PROCESSING PROTEIN 7 [Anaeramoeba flamelloides]